MIKNSLYIFAGRASNALFVFLLTLVVSRHLGPTLFGIFSFLTAVVVAANCFACLGLDTWMVREVTKTPSQGKYYLSNILGLKIASSLVTIALIFIISRTTDLPQTTLELLWVLSISLLFNTVSQTLWHYGNCFKQFTYHFTLWALSSFLKSLLGITMVLLYRGLEPLIWAVVVAEAITLIFSFYIIRRRFGKFIPKFQFEVWKDFLTRSAPIAAGMIISVFYFRLDIVMLQLMTEEQIVGFYSAAYKLFEVTIIFPHSLMLILFPTLVEHYNSNRPLFKDRFRKGLMLFSLSGGIIAYVLWKFSHGIIVLIYGENFFPAIDVLNILAWAVFLLFVNFLLSSVLIISDRAMINTWNIMGATVLNIILNLVWIPQYGAVGAAWATLVCETALIAALSFQAHKLLKK